MHKYCMNRQEVRVTCADDEILLCLGEGGGVQDYLPGKPLFATEYRLRKVSG